MSTSSMGTSNRKRRSSLVQQIKQLNFANSGVLGRDSELETLRKILGNTSKQNILAGNSVSVLAKTPVVLVRGYSGVGKSALIKKAFEDEDDCCFCLGKHEQSKSNQFNAWNELLGVLISALEDEPTDLIDRVQAQLEEVLDNLHVLQLKRTFPVTSRLLMTEVTASQDPGAFGTTKAALAKLIRVVVRNLDRPLVICLDDIQWSNHPALSLFMTLASETTLHGLVLVGTYRDNEVEENPTHILNTFLLPELEGEKCQVTDIALGNLELESLNQVVSSLVAMKPDKTLELSEVVMTKTNGNIFFALQVLRVLHQQKLLYFSVDLYSWAWELDRVAAETDLSDNVVELVTLKLKRLPPLSKRVLMIGSLIGSKFHRDLIDGVLEAVLAAEQATMAANRSSPALPSYDKPMAPVEDIVVNSEACTPDGQERTPETSADVKEDEQLPPDIRENTEQHTKKGRKQSILESEEKPLHVIDYEGLIQDGLFTYHEGFYRFCHDRIQQAAIELFESPLEREYNHLIIGRFLQERVNAWEDDPDSPKTNAGQSNLGSAKMLCCEQMNLGSSCMASEEEKLVLAKLNLEAGELASRRSAFQAAIAFLRTGLSLLKDLAQDIWAAQYETVLKMHNLLALVLNTRGEYDEADKVVEEVFKRARTERDKRSAISEKVKLFSAQNDQIKQAISFGVKSLKSAGVKFPSGKVGLHHVLMEFFKVKKKLKKIKSEDELLNMPECQDEELRQIIYTLSLVGYASFFVHDPNMMLVAFLRGLTLSLKHGLSKYTSHGLAFYSCLLGSMGDFDAGYEAGNLAIKVMEKFGARECNARTMSTIYCMSKHLKEPIHQHLDGYLKYYEEAMEGGDTEYAVGHIAAYTEVYLFAGLPLRPFLKDLARFKKQFEKFKNIKLLYIFNAFVQGIHSICGLSENPFKLDGEIMRERAFLNAVLDNDVGRWGFYFVKLYVAYILNQNGPEVQQAAEAFWALKNPLKGTPNFFLMNCCYLNGMAAMALEAKTGRKRKFRKIREQSIALIQTWEKKAVPWVSHMLLILRAERDRLNRKKSQGEVKAAYDAAIRMASRTGYLNDCALANERCARYFYAVVGDEGWGQFYLNKAVSLYLEWGATAKVRLLSEEFSTMRDEISALSESASTARGAGIRARERFSASASEKHFAKISDLFSQELSCTASMRFGGASSTSLHSGGRGSSTSSVVFGRSSEFFAGSVDSESVREKTL